MKKLVSLLFAVALLAAPFSLSAQAAEAEPLVPESETVEAFATGINDGEVSAMAASTSLITGINLRLYVSNGALMVSGSTSCADGVTKCGFTSFILQRQLSDGTWTDYRWYTADELLASGSYFLITRNANAANGWYYRIIATHYAEKVTLLIFKSTQTINNNTAKLWF